MAVLSGWACAEPAKPEVDPAKLRQVETILRNGGYGSEADRFNSLTDQLVAFGELDVMQAKLAELTRLPAGQGSASYLQGDASALDEAIIRLTWKIAPIKLIEAWFDKAADQEGAWREMPRPRRIVDGGVARMFPSRLFYTIEDPLSGEPPPVRPVQMSRGLFAIDRDGSLQIITSLDELKALFVRRAFPRSDAGDVPFKEIAMAWLKMSGRLECYELIPEEGVLVRKAGRTTIVQGTASPRPESGAKGTLSVTITFDQTGLPTEITEVNALNPGPVPP